MFQNLPEIHAAIRTMTNEELKQLLIGAKMMLDQGLIDQEKALEIAGAAIAHMLERSITA